MKVICLFIFNCVLWTFPVTNLFKDHIDQSAIYVDEWIENLQLVKNKPAKLKPKEISKFIWNILQFSQSIPVRIIQDKNLIQILPPTSTRKREELSFRADILALYNLDLVKKLNSMNGWFLRCRVNYKSLVKNRYILMGIMMSAGWDNYQKEWWHYQLFNARDYKILNLGF